ncbi:MAG: hypothetical protein ACREJX_18355 [Polyangiaceae bacterium]
MQIKIALGASILGLGVALAACSSSSSSSGTDGGTTATDSGTAKDSGGSQGGDAGGGCVPVNAPGNSIGVGKYCTTEAPCEGNGQATLCAVIGGDPTEDFCTFVCTPSDGGTDPCGEGVSCACDPSHPSQCGCTPLSCQ